jgi:3'(2'), 5'-bisphosphate nucleotidase
LPNPSFATDDREFAAELARGAGAVLLALRDEADAAGTVVDLAAFKDVGDARAQEWLAPARPRGRTAEGGRTE